MVSTFSSIQTINSSITNFPCLPIIKKPKLHISLSKTSISCLRVECCISGNYNEDEEMDKIRRLQNGSDVRGVALLGEKGRSIDLTPSAVEAIAESFGEWVIKGLEKEKEKDVAISLGKDPRISGNTLSVAVFAGLSRAGCIVFDMGLATTPACFMSTILPPSQFDASIMMTASHLPYTRNGLKFFTKKGGLTSTEVEEICEKAARKYVNRFAKVSTTLPTRPTKVDFMRTYAKHLRDIIKERVNHPYHYDTPLKGFQRQELEIINRRIVEDRDCPAFGISNQEASCWAYILLKFSAIVSDPQFYSGPYHVI